MKIDCLYGSHGNELFGQHVYEQATQEGMHSNIRMRAGHPEALMAGVRSFSLSEIMSCYQYPRADRISREHLQAARNLAWLGRNRGSEEALVYDIHDTTVSRIRYASFGSIALQAAIAGAYFLGHDRAFIEDCSFYNTVPNGVALEETITTQKPEEYDRKAACLLERLEVLARMDAEDLRHIYPIAIQNMQIYRSHDIPATAPDGNLANYIPELEEMGDHAPFSELSLSPKLREALQLPARMPLYANIWQYNNMSPEVPRLGSYIDADGDKQHRRSFFGAVLIPQPAPVVMGKWALSAPLR